MFGTNNTRGAVERTAKGTSAGRPLCLVTWLLGIAFASVCPGQDWPQMLGPNRDGHAAERSRLDAQALDSAKVAWRIGLGSGFGGPAIVGDTVYIMDRLGNQERLQAFELDAGVVRWRCEWPASYRGTINPDNGPRCVPTIAAGRAVCYGAAGDLACVNLEDGQLLWHRPLRQEYDADDGYFGAGSSPLVMQDKVIVCVGGSRGGIVALDLDSGETRWTATEYDASYAAPVAVDPRTALVVTRLRTVLVDVNDGSVLSEVAFGSRGPTVNAATPIPVGQGKFFLTASYGVGAMLLDTQGRKLNPIYSGRQLISSQYNTPVIVNKRIIGIDGREDAGVAGLRAIDAVAEKIIWDRAGFGTAHLIAVGDRVLVLGLDGNLRLFDGSADDYRELGQITLPTGTYRAPPALAQGRFLARNSDATTGRSQLVCLQLASGSENPR